MSDWLRVGKLMDFCAVYYTTQLVRCAALSLVLTGLVLLLRKVLFARRTFARGILWAAFLLLPFLGRLKLFYESSAVLGITWRVTYVTMTCLWADRIYMAGIFLSALYIFGKRFRLRRAVAGMETVFLDGIRVRVTDMQITPFAVGLWKPEIVVPRVLLERYSGEELQAVVGHEQTHIRLGHLWLGLAWDVLRCLLWVNPFLTVIQKQFRSDMEDICDRVCIQRSGGTAYEYGTVLLKTLKLLRSEPEETVSAVTYAGEREYADMKRRMCEIVGFRPYRKRRCAGMAVALVLTFAALLGAVHAHSYARCNENSDIMVGNYDGKPEIVSDDTERLAQMVSYDDRYIYVDREAFEDFLEEKGADGEIWIVFGGFYKLPGLGGAAEACIYERGSQDRIVQIPYESIMDNWYLGLLRWL